jgi:hypothetical protein
VTTSLVDYLSELSIREIQEFEDSRACNEISELLWVNSDKCMCNILRYSRPLNTKLKLFLWFKDWATTRRPRELYSSL